MSRRRISYDSLTQVDRSIYVLRLSARMEFAQLGMKGGPAHHSAWMIYVAEQGRTSLRHVNARGRILCVWHVEQIERLCSLDIELRPRFDKEMSALDQLDWSTVRKHYDDRIQVHRQLLKLHDGKLLDKFSKLLLGISDATGNFSANEHGLGPQILGTNPDVLVRLDELAWKFRQLKKGREVPKIIRDADLRCMRIGVGSEASCMLNPQTCWVANTRSIWTHLLIQHADDVAIADEALRLYHEADPTGEMYYPIWGEIHRLLEVTMTRIAKEGMKLAQAEGITPGNVMFLWADAIANQLYAQHH